VLLAEHEAPVAAMLVRYLARDGFDVRLAGTPELALAGLADAAAPPAAAVLDLTMPDLDPRRVRRALRTPVVFLVSAGPRPRGLNATSGLSATAGAAKATARRWLIRPFGPRQLVAAVQEVLRENHAEAARPAPVPMAIDGLRLDPARRMAITDDREVPLTAGECGVLAALLASPGRPRTRRQLLEATGRTAGDRAADVYIAQLRAKLGPNSLIRTVRGAGYVISGAAPEAPPELGGMANPRGQ
jgi:DNA-binding response OmpR family regulator